ncbi:phosphoribosyltransferase family protein [Amycolatopsis benzoatilytica]|uniref:phosphoribosyltransferase family protein n=1 Tax=Amycolatopsis benzoatilytica TaxID=346045 RepID=UPI000360E473|nr:phosphoribosyltransferase family protein [Amycolatopsis benzoatilytica]
MPFTDRAEAGRRLAERLESLRGEEVVVFGLPRGGVPVAYEVARALAAPLDLIVVRKLPVPGQPELAAGAIGEGDVLVVNEDVVRHTRVSRAEFAAAERAGRAELQRRAERWRPGRARVSPAGRVAVLVDDGVATGATARAACQVARAEGAKRVILAVPVGAHDSIGSLARDADEVVCLETPAWFRSVGQWYRRFGQVSDEEVADLLRLAAREAPSLDEDVEVPVRGARLAGRLTLPGDPAGLVVFAHGSGSSRHSPRNVRVAATLNRAGLGTLLLDLLTPAEETDRARVFDVALLGERLVEVTRWLKTRPDTAALPVGCFGASTGAAAALLAAAEAGTGIRAVVSRGGRPDLAAHVLGAVGCPTLLIVGGRDGAVLRLNQQAQEALGGPSELAVVPGATHLFAEPGALGQVAELARAWFLRHLPAA